jgi:hypothetical protein
MPNIDTSTLRQGLDRLADRTAQRTTGTAGNTAPTSRGNGGIVSGGTPVGAPAMPTIPPTPGVKGDTGPAPHFDSAPWAGTTNYALNDIVRYGTTSWASLVADNLGNTPANGSLYWTVVARDGEGGTGGGVSLSTIFYLQQRALMGV